MVFCVGCGCDVDGKEKKHRLLLSGPDVDAELYSLWEEYFHKEVLKSGRDLDDFQDHLRSERAYLCRPCKDLIFKLSCIQNKLAERITKAITAVEGCIEVNNNGSLKRKAPAPSCNVPRAKRPLLSIGTSPPVVV
jgi:hypothetical protein